MDDASKDAKSDDEARFRTICEMAPIGIFLTDPMGGGLYMNPENARQMGMTPAESVGDGWSRAIHPEDRERVRDAFYTATQERRPYRGVSRYLRPDGEVVHVDVHATGIYDGDRFLGYVGTAEDITLRLKIEAQLRESQKLDSLGRLAGIIAHDFNNLTAAIRNQVTLALRALESEANIEVARARLTDIDEAAKTAINLTRQILAFARQESSSPTLVDLADLLRGLEPLVRSLVGEGIETDVQLSEEREVVRADATQLQQLVINLVTNARDAMPEGGRLSFIVESAVIDPKAAAARGMSAGKYAALTVRDTGTGIPDELRSHVFEPFFTTKAASGGTGLGLSACYGIARQHGGTILVESQLGRGTSFRVYLPTAASP